jgi:hypothetical protein
MIVNFLLIQTKTCFRSTWPIRKLPLLILENIPLFYHFVYFSLQYFYYMVIIVLKYQFVILSGKEKLSLKTDDPAHDLFINEFEHYCNKLLTQI